jgi:hypothetical protein
MYTPPIRPITIYEANTWGYEPKTHFNKLQVYKNKVVRIIRKLPKLKPVDTLHEQTGKETIKKTMLGS